MKAHILVHGYLVGNMNAIASIREYVPCQRCSCQWQQTLTVTTAGVGCTSGLLILWLLSCETNRQVLPIFAIKHNDNKFVQSESNASELPETKACHDKYWLTDCTWFPNVPWMLHSPMFCRFSAHYTWSTLS
jgi:hypothetical protein